jgi:hypothetical protein
MCSRSMFGHLTVFLRRRRVLLGVFVLAYGVMMGSLMVMMRGGVMVGSRLMVVLTRRVVR